MTDRSAAKSEPAAGTSKTKSEYPLHDQEFRKLRGAIRELTGISVSESKRHLVYRRLEGRLRDLELDSFGAYLDLLQSDDASERQQFMNAVTTNKTSFFREPHHFDYLQQRILPALLAGPAAASRRLRLWSAGCSSGEEPYSIAMTLLTAPVSLDGWDVKMLCTDIDSEMLNRCVAGEYPDSKLAAVSSLLKERFFERCDMARGPGMRVGKALREITRFRHLNLLERWPMRRPFDVIVCRNVFIYFEKDLQQALISRFADILNPGGYLILGHSESLFRISDRFELIGQTTYRKVR